METIGTYLTQQREKAGISIEAVSSITKIRCSLLKKIEEDRLDEVPGGVFLRGFVKSYAQAIRIKPDRALELLDSQLMPQSARTASRTALGTKSPSRFRIAHLLILITALLTMIAAWYLISNPHPRPEVVSSAQSTDVDSGTTRSFYPLSQRE